VVVEMKKISIDVVEKRIENSNALETRSDNVNEVVTATLIEIVEIVGGEITQTMRKKITVVREVRRGAGETTEIGVGVGM
jgi:hypothetical protein